jgi:hypothetical protein
MSCFPKNPPGSNGEARRYARLRRPLCTAPPGNNAPAATAESVCGLLKATGPGVAAPGPASSLNHA